MFHPQFAHIMSIGMAIVTLNDLSVLTKYTSATNSFSSSRQYHKQARDGSEEIWTKRIYYTTEEKFPTVLRRSQVINMATLEISPVEAALEEVEQKTKELSSLFSRYDTLAKTSQQVSTNPLAMSLNSAVDTPVSSGISFYKQSFFNPDYLARNPERANVVERLNLAIEAHVRKTKDRSWCSC
jgi:dedicator of cytokinesis protein 3